MTFHEWYNSDDEAAVLCRGRIEAGERGNPLNPAMAAELAFVSGKVEAIKEAGEKMAFDLLSKVNRQ